MDNEKISDKLIETTVWHNSVKNTMEKEQVLRQYLQNVNSQIKSSFAQDNNNLNSLATPWEGREKREFIVTTGKLEEKERMEFLENWF